MALVATISVLSGGSFNNLTNVTASIGFATSGVSLIEPINQTIAGVVCNTRITLTNGKQFYSNTSTSAVIASFNA